MLCLRYLACLLSLALLSLQNRVENLLHAVNFFQHLFQSAPSLLKYAPHTTRNKQQINQHSSPASMSSLGVSSGDGFFPGHPHLPIRFWDMQGKNILSVDTSLSRLSSPRLFGWGPGQTRFIMSSAREWRGWATWSSGFISFDILTVNVLLLASPDITQFRMRGSL